MDVLAAFQGITTPPSQLYSLIEQAGWQPVKTAWDDSLGQFYAEAQSPHGERIRRTGPNDRTAIGNLLIAIMRRNYMRTGAQIKVGMWKTMFTDQLADIAKAYAEAPVYDPKAAQCFKELADDSVRRAQELHRQLTIEITDNPEPYPNTQEMANDIHQKRHFWVSRANSEHPIWTVDQNVAFRIVHDVLGHAVSGGDFGWQGENLACAAHFPLLTPTAQQALFTECIAQTAYAAFYRSFGPQKVALFPQFYENAQNQENGPGHTGVHPSQVTAPTAMPAVEDSGPPEQYGGLPKGTVAPHQEAFGLTPLMNPAFSKLAVSGQQWWHPDFYPHIEPHIQEHAENPEQLNQFRQVTMALRNADELAARGAPGADYVLTHDLYKLLPDANQALAIENQWLAVHPEYKHGTPEYWNRIDFNDQANKFLSRHYAGTIADPNFGWSSGFDPLQLQVNGVGNAYLDHGDPLESQSVMDNASKIDTGWSRLQDGNGGPDYARMKQAIVNAFRAVLLSPRKDLRWNAVHYQDISHIPAEEDNPQVYWEALESRRRAWNASQGIAPDAHMPYFKFLRPFESIIYQKNPDLGPVGAKEKAERILFDWWVEEQQNVEEQDADKPSDKQRSADEIERRANEALARRLKSYLQDYNPKTDVIDDNPAQLSLVASGDNYIDELAEEIMNECKEDEIPDGYSHDEIMALFREYALLALTKGKDTTAEDVHDAWAAWMAEHESDHDSLIPFDELSKKVRRYDEPYVEYIHKHSAGQYNLLTGEEGGKYGAFMGTHLKAIAQISQHSDDLLDAALKDVRDHDGSGYYFRSKVLQFGIPGVGPKVASFAWLLLQPMTSQLATIDTHMMDALGHHYEKEMNNRDYPKFERELAAGRDASGHSHIPLGAFQWGMWDFKRTGPGSHQDHSALRVLDPLQHQFVDWQAKAPNLKGDSWLDQAPDWWRNTQDARDAVAEDWDTNIAPNYAQNAYPFQTLNDVVAKLGGSGNRVFKGLTLLNGEEHKFETGTASGKGQYPTHLDYMVQKGIHPDQVAHYWAEDETNDRTHLNMYEDFYRREFPRTREEYLNTDWDFIAKLAAGESDDEFHIGVTLPEEVFRKLAEFADHLDMVHEDPESYHCTVLWTPQGYEKKELHEWVEKNSVSGLRFYNARLDRFPCQGEHKYAVVVRFDAPELTTLANQMLDEAEDMGLDITRFPGGFKPHITIGFTDESVPREKLDLEFRGGPLYVSIPRPLRGTGDFLDSKLSYDDPHSFAYWWNKEKPHYPNNANKMADYAVGTGTSRKDAKEYIENHKDDVRGDFDKFQRDFFKRFDRTKRSSRIAQTGRIPWFEHEGQRHIGQPGQTIMEHAVSTLGLSTPQIWKLLGDSAGKDVNDGSTNSGTPGSEVGRVVGSPVPSS